ncbi:MAG: hypothetical protein WCJ64_17965 [Rhodospirillaceae bacterium]
MSRDEWAVLERAASLESISVSALIRTASLAAAEGRMFVPPVEYDLLVNVQAQINGGCSNLNQTVRKFHAAANDLDADHMEARLNTIASIATELRNYVYHLEKILKAHRLV